ncbi:DUF6600 domain-containing protein [Roseateles sp.]|uniref:DUF6600 domain-containing protein n=1 Tax=Roseateles sp. TaxID=1971397 RepID=UPI0039ED69ED
MATSVAPKLVLNRRAWRILALTLLVAIAPGARAQDGDRDPPTRAARVVSVVGDAWLFDQDSREWTRISRNQTVGEGDRLRTDDRARVSLRVGSTTVWVDERSDLELSQLDEGQTLLQLDRGDVALRLRSAQNAAETRLRTREGTAQPEREGLYRVEQLDRGSKLYVWQGRMRFEWARGASPVSLGTGEQVELWWPDGPRAERSPLYSDGFGDWVLAENREEGDRQYAGSARYVSPEMTGAEDLDRYGRWETAPDYGAVWVPTTLVVADWAPYRYGHWAWSRLWGWTWVDDAPWGFAPFHYGRWVNWGGRWCWAPGPYVHRPVYAPALVGWVGGGAVSVGISIGSRPPPPRFGWYPLAPREVYVPAYHHSPRYVNRINDPRDLRDPVTVQRPHRYRDVPTAVSMLPSPGAAIQPMPVRGPDRKGEPGWARPLPVAPGRNDLAAVLPAAPTRPAESDLPRRAPRGPDAGAGWRSDGQLPVRRDQRGPEPQAPLPTAVQPAAPTVVPQPQVPQVPQMRPGSEQQPQRGGDNIPWRAQQQREAQQQQQREAQQQQQREAQQQQQREAQQRDIQQRREELQRREEQQQRREEQQRRMPQPEPQRQVEGPRVQMPQAPQPPRVQQRDEGPQRGRQDGVPVRRDRPQNDARPNERQAER